MLLLLTREPWLVVVAAMLGNVAVGAGETGPFLVDRAGRHRPRGRAGPSHDGAERLQPARLRRRRRRRRDDRGRRAAHALRGVPGRRRSCRSLAYAALGGGAAGARAGAGGARRSTPLIRRIAALFALDSFAGGFVVQSLVAYFLHVRFGLGLEALGRVFFVAQLLTAVSLLLAPRLARGASACSPTMVVHAPGVEPVPDRHRRRADPPRWRSPCSTPASSCPRSTSPPARPGSCSSCPTTSARPPPPPPRCGAPSAQAITPWLTGWIMQSLALVRPFVLGGALKIVYDVLLWKDVQGPRASRRPRGMGGGTGRTAT